MQPTRATQIYRVRSLPQTALQRLATGLRERCYQTGDAIFRKGDQSEGLGVVLRGRVRTVTTSPEGREKVLKVFGPGRTFGDIPVFDDGPQPADAMAMSESVVVFIPQGDLVDCLREQPTRPSRSSASLPPAFAPTNRWLRISRSVQSSLASPDCSSTAGAEHRHYRRTAQFESPIHAGRDRCEGRLSSRGGPASAQDAGTCWAR